MHVCEKEWRNAPANSMFVWLKYRIHNKHTLAHINKNRTNKIWCISYLFFSETLFLRFVHAKYANWNPVGLREWVADGNVNNLIYAKHGNFVRVHKIVIIAASCVELQRGKICLHTSNHILNAVRVVVLHFHAFGVFFSLDANRFMYVEKTYFFSDSANWGGEKNRYFMDLKICNLKLPRIRPYNAIFK